MQDDELISDAELHERERRYLENHPNPLSDDATKDLQQLGSGNTKYPQRPEDAVLETFENRWVHNDYVVELECPEFTSLCPKTGQPDFATFKILYIPDKRLIESKALKLYLFSFRNHGEFHESVTNRIAHDLYEVMHPKIILVRGDFFPRGGISINPTVILPNDVSPVLEKRLMSAWREDCAGQQ